MSKIRNTLLSATILGVSAVSANATPVYYSDEATFLGASGGGLSFESFESNTLPNSTTVDFGAGTFTCAGTSFCPGFFGQSGGTAKDGIQSVFFATPDTSTFTFNSAINAFGIWQDGLGDVDAPVTFTLTDSNGNSHDVATNYTGTPISNFLGGTFFGVIDTMAAFTSITFSGDNSGDGVFFDSMYYGKAGVSPVPLPAAFPLLGAALAGMGFAGWRRKRKAV